MGLMSPHVEANIGFSAPSWM